MARAAASVAGILPALSSKYPAFTPDALVAVSKHRRICGAKAERELGHRPRPLETTLHDTLEWFEARGLLAE